ncbi:CLUMA_CG014639, isoform A [Clunio marinus]|uniref:CLUMA_CG014639, isoform A n=1 Tax=Clunio marinus TaxID=568069 RepID=A0A1J1IM73_9DIPT|nr:CLUMA_CG014639, isoform A [Clunio marinus]
MKKVCSNIPKMDKLNKLTQLISVLFTECFPGKLISNARNEFFKSLQTNRMLSHHVQFGTPEMKRL